MGAKLVAAALLILIALPFTAPFASCDVAELTQHSADASATSFNLQQALVDDNTAVAERSRLTLVMAAAAGPVSLAIITSTEIRSLHRLLRSALVPPPATRPTVLRM